MKFTLGCDPEVLLTDKNLNFKPAIDTWGGLKEAPKALPIGEGYFVQEDNVALEFNIPPSPDSQKFQDNIRKIVNYLAEQSVEQFDLHFNKSSAVSFPPQELTDIRARQFGCDPDYCAWNGKRNPSPRCLDPNLRTAGGHVHIGIDRKDYFWTPKDMFRLGRLLDLHLGVAATLMDYTGDERRALYGKHGAMRIKDYGMEYRVLSNFWIFDDHITKWVWDSVENAINDLAGGRELDNMEALIIEAIDNNNKKLAAEIVAEHHLLVV